MQPSRNFLQEQEPALKPAGISGPRCGRCRYSKASTCCLPASAWQHQLVLYLKCLKRFVAAKSLLSIAACCAITICKDHLDASAFPSLSMPAGHAPIPVGFDTLPVHCDSLMSKSGIIPLTNRKGDVDDLIHLQNVPASNLLLMPLLNAYCTVSC